MKPLYFFCGKRCVWGVHLSFSTKTQKKVPLPFLFPWTTHTKCCTYKTLPKCDVNQYPVKMFQSLPNCYNFAIGNWWSKRHNWWQQMVTLGHRLSPEGYIEKYITTNTRPNSTPTDRSTNKGDQQMIKVRSGNSREDCQYHIIWTSFRPHKMIIIIWQNVGTIPRKPKVKLHLEYQDAYKVSSNYYYVCL